MTVQPCNPYHARTVARKFLAMPDGISVYKLYYLDITGREDRKKYEWEHSTSTFEQFEQRLQSEFGRIGIPGVGFVTAFPHITKVFRFAPSVETVLHASAFNTLDLMALDLNRGSGWMEFACYAEARIAAAEYDAWARADSVETYLNFLSSFDDGMIMSSDKLLRWWAARSPRE